MIMPSFKGKHTDKDAREVDDESLSRGSASSCGCRSEHGGAELCRVSGSGSGGGGQKGRRHAVRQVERRLVAIGPIARHIAPCAAGPRPLEVDSGLGIQAGYAVRSCSTFLDAMAGFSDGLRDR